MTMFLSCDNFGSVDLAQECMSYNFVLMLFFLLLLFMVASVVDDLLKFHLRNKREEKDAKR